MGKKSLVFLGGPFQFAIKKQNGFDRRLRMLIQRLLEELEDAGVQVLSAHRFESFGLMNVEGHSKMVTQRDFQWMSQCDVFVALLPLDAKCKLVRTDGTCIELGWASALRKPIIVVRPVHKVYSHLITGLAAITFATMLDYEEVVQNTGLVKDAILTALAATGKSVNRGVMSVAAPGFGPQTEERIESEPREKLT